MLKKITLVSCLLFVTLITKAQEKEKKEIIEKSYTPYELLSNYYNQDFNPFKKGTIYFGASMSLTDRSQENTENIFEKTLEGNRVNFSLLLKGGYFINDYNMIGLNFNIFENKFEGTIFRDPDTVESNTIKRGFSFTPNYRTSIPLTANERLSFFTLAGLTIGTSNTLKRETKNTDEIEKSFTENYNFRLGLSSGVTFFAMENFAFEIQADVLGYEVDIENKTKNGAEKSKDVRHNVDFKLNLLSIKFGVAYYL